jgi:hypothetical protein
MKNMSQMHACIRRQVDMCMFPKSLQYGLRVRVWVYAHAKSVRTRERERESAQSWDKAARAAHLREQYEWPLALVIPLYAQARQSRLACTHERGIHARGRARTSGHGQENTLKVETAFMLASTYGGPVCPGGPAACTIVSSKLVTCSCGSCLGEC